MDPSASFSLRDFLQYVLPAMLAGCLYVPLFAPHNSVSPEGIIFGAIILSYLVWSPTYRLAMKFYEILPLTSTRTTKAFQESKATGKKWDREKLRYLLTNDEREYFYSHGSFAALYAVAGMHLFIYAGCNFVLLVRAAWSAKTVAAAGATRWVVVADAGRKVLDATTPSMADFQVNTLLLFVASAILSYFSYKQYMLYYELLSKEGGQYDQLAQKYFKVDESVAISVWGQAKYHTGPEEGNLFRDAKVTLKKSDDTIVDSGKVDAQGRFQFVGKFAECLSAEGKVHIDLTGTKAGEASSNKVFVQKFRLAKGQVPLIEVRVPKPVPPSPPPQSGAKT